MTAAPSTLGMRPGEYQAPSPFPAIAWCGPMAGLPAIAGG